MNRSLTLADHKRANNIYLEINKRKGLDESQQFLDELNEIS